MKRIEKDERSRGIFGSVLFRLIVSYVILVFVVALLTGTASFLFFQKKYYDELERLHLFMLHKIAEELRSKVINVSKLIYLDVTTELLKGYGDIFGEEDIVQGNYHKLYKTHRMLGELMGRYGDVVEEVSLYYRKANMVISFPGGVHFGSELANESYFRPFNIFLEMNKRDLWIYRKGEAPALYRCFPILAEARDSTVIVRISLRTDTLQKIISHAMEEERGAMYILDDGGFPICNSPGALWNTVLESEFRKLLRSESAVEDAATIVRGEDTQNLIVTVPIADTGWRLVNRTPTAYLYRKGDNIRLILTLICLVAIILGLGISALLTARIYNPLGLLIRRVRQLFGSDLPTLPEVSDEYRIIGYAIDGLSSALERSKPLIKHEVATALLFGNLSHLENLNDLFRALGLGSFPSRTVACLVQIRPRGNDRGGIEELVFRYHVAEELEALPGFFVVSCVLTSGGIGLVVEYRESKTVREEIKEIIKTIMERLGTQITVSIGSIAESPSQVTGSFELARKIAKYGYFFPERTVLSETDGFLARESRFAELPLEVLSDLAEGLRKGKPGLAEAAVRSTLDFCRSDQASAEACRRELARFVRTMAAVQAELFPLDSQRIQNQAESILSDTADVKELMEALLANIAGFLDRCTVPQDERTAVVVAQVIRIIDDDLGGDLSLSHLGAAIGLSSSYLGKLFLSATGTHLVDFVTERRLSEAARLLCESNADVQDVGRDVGFNSPAYFIRRFKERYGRTPQEYRIMSKSGGLAK